MAVGANAGAKAEEVAVGRGVAVGTRVLSREGIVFVGVGRISVAEGAIALKTITSTTTKPIADKICERRCVFSFPDFFFMLLIYSFLF